MVTGGNVEWPIYGPRGQGVSSQILVSVEKGAQYIINPEDKVTRDGEAVPFDEILDRLSNPHDWVDLWIEDDDKPERHMFVRLLGRAVVILTQAYIYPALEDTKQA
jgi:hypothetical protein